jgi:hypothetical protein
LVWNVQTHAWGVHVYDVQGFIGPAGKAPGVVAQTDDQID